MIFSSLSGLKALMPFIVSTSIVLIVIAVRPTLRRGECFSFGSSKFESRAQPDHRPSFPPLVSSLSLRTQRATKNDCLALQPCHIPV